MRSLAILAILASASPANAQAPSECRAWTEAGWLVTTGTGILVQQDTGGGLEPLSGVDVTLTWFAHANVGARLSYQFRTASAFVAESGSTQQIHLPAAQLVVRGVVHRHVALFAAAGPALAVTYVEHWSPTNVVSASQLDAAGVVSAGLDVWARWIGFRLEIDALIHRYSSGAGGSVHLVVPWA